MRTENEHSSLDPSVFAGADVYLQRHDEIRNVCCADERPGTRLSARNLSSFHRRVRNTRRHRVDIAERASHRTAAHTSGGSRSRNYHGRRDGDYIDGADESNGGNTTRYLLALHLRRLGTMADYAGAPEMSANIHP